MSRETLQFQANREVCHLRRADLLQVPWAQLLTSYLTWVLVSAFLFIHEGQY